MAKKDMYEINKNINKLYSRGYTNFLNPNLFNKVKYKLKSSEYNKYYPYEDSDKIILYSYSNPNVRLFEIKSYNKLTHSMILGSLYGLNISDDMFGDIIVNDNNYYVYLLDDIANFVLDNFNMVGNYYIKLEEVDINLLKDYKKKYEEYNIIVSSLRIDTVISRIIGINREKIKDKIKNHDIILNYEVLENNSVMLKYGDVFSIRKYGKYKYIETVKMTKKDNYIIKYYKYI